MSVSAAAVNFDVRSGEIAYINQAVVDASFDLRRCNAWAERHLMKMNGHGPLSSSTGPISTANYRLLGLTAAVGALQFGMFPLLWQPSIWTVALLLSAIIVTTPLHWGLLHESIHGNLSENAGANRGLGKLLSIMLFMSWDMLRFGHLVHHDFNRHQLDRPEVIQENAGGSFATVAYYVMLLGGHSALSAVAPFAMLLPLSVTTRIFDGHDGDPEIAKIRAAAVRSFSNPGRQRRIMTDLCVEGMLILITVACWKGWWPAFAVSIAVRYCVLSLLDNSHHYGTSLDSGRAARNTSLPRWASWLVMNHHLHGIHHATPQLEWTALGTTISPNAATNENWLVCILRQLRGPLRAGDLRPLTD